MTNTTVKPLLVSKKDAAAMLSVTEREVIRLINAGELERRYIGGGTKYYRIPYASLEAYVATLSETKK